MTRLERADWPATAAIAAAVIAAREAGFDLEVHRIERPRSLEEAATRLGIAPDRLLKTLVVRRAADDHLLVLLPGNAQLSWPKLRAHLGVSRLSLPDAEEAREVTGFERGTITPFGVRGGLPVLADATIAGAGTVTVGSGAHGVSLRLDADALLVAVDAEVADLT
ncbi:MAG: aminoacyl-tRNA deacylase [Nitriliruptoraceae bacterium]